MDSSSASFFGGFVESAAMQEESLDLTEEVNESAFVFIGLGLLFCILMMWRLVEIAIPALAREKTLVPEPRE